MSKPVAFYIIGCFINNWLTDGFQFSGIHLSVACHNNGTINIVVFCPFVSTCYSGTDATIFQIIYQNNTIIVFIPVEYFRWNKKLYFLSVILFHNNISKGDTREVCEAYVDGVEYNSLNHAGRISAGLDIIETIKGEMGISGLPVWIDQGESISEIPESGYQTIALIVAGQADGLLIEIPESGAKWSVNVK